MSSSVFVIVFEGPCNAKDFNSLIMSEKFVICFFTRSDKFEILSKFSIDFEIDKLFSFAKSLNF